MQTKHPELPVLTISIHFPDRATVTFKIPASSALSASAEEVVLKASALLDQLSELPPDTLHWY
jgi:hypothetical protein